MNEHKAYAPWMFSLARIFEQAGKPLFLVGGAVRNVLMGLTISDVDVCGPALPQEVMDLCQGTPVQAVLRAAHFGTVELHLADESGRYMAEYTTFREDSYRCGHQPSEVRFTTDIQVDALRRDFSVNALYQPIYGDGLGDIVDPTGGLAHLAAGVLHTVTKDPEQVLKDDGLRILRAARFQAELGLAPTPALLASAQKHVHLLRDIYPERLHAEFRKILMADLRYPMLRRRAPATLSGLETLRDMGAWGYLFPGRSFDREAAMALAGPALAEKGGAEDGGAEGCPVVAQRLALLFWRGAGDALAQDLRALHFSSQESEQAGALARVLGQAMAAGPAGELRVGLSRFAGAQAGLAALRFGAAAFRALEAVAGDLDSDGKDPYGVAAHGLEALIQALSLPGVPLSLRVLAVNGHDVQAIARTLGKPDHLIGGTLQALWQHTVEGGCPNQREALLRLAEAWLRDGKI